jgi:uncharacterized membrane protein
MAETMNGGAMVRDVGRKFAEWLNPFVGSASSTLETNAYLDSFGTSLMPRTSVLQGAAGGLGVIAARGVSSVVETAHGAVLPAGASLGVKLTARAVEIAIGRAAASTPEQPGETMWVAGFRTSGAILEAAAISGAIFDVGNWLRKRYPASNVSRPLAVSALGIGGALYWASQRLALRRDEIEPWPVPQSNTVAAALGTGVVVSNLGRLLGVGFRASRNSIINWAGPGFRKDVLARTANAALWAAGASALYNAGVGYIGRANEKVDPGYATPPVTPHVSGSEESLLPFELLGQQGRRYVNDVVTPELIEQTLGEPAKAHPIRTYVGYNSEPVYMSGRAELALMELERTGAFDREYLLLVSPTGTGWVDHTMIEAVELLTRGDIATCCIQYGRFPSFLSVQKVSLGRRQFRLLLYGIVARLSERAPEDRPKVLVFGESLGAWASSDVVMYQGIGGFDHYGVDRALWFGLPGLAKWSRNGMAQGSSELVPEGTVGVFDHPDQLEALSDEERDRLRAIILSHDNDPIAALSPDIALKEPDWLKANPRGRGVPTSMQWIPIVTLIQTMIDAANAMVTIPGQFLSFGHDYRADTARMVHAAYQLPEVTPEQMANVEEALRKLEMERADRIAAKSADVAPPTPSQKAQPDAIGGVPMVQPRTRGAQWGAGGLFGRLKRREGTVQ